MPAIMPTPSEVLVLPRIASPDPATHAPRPVRRVVTGVQTFEGEGFPVRRPFPGQISMAESDPFLLLDQMGEVEYAPGEPKGTPWHPHRGFETVTYMLDGVLEHQDTTGGGGVISDGSTQWMTAGSGLLHIESPPEWLVMKGGIFHGVQLWVNLPASQKMSPPQYQDLSPDDVTLLTSDDGGTVVRLIAGELGGIAGPGQTQTPIIYAHATLSPGAEFSTPWPQNYNALVYVLSGNGTAGAERAPIHSGQMAVFGAGDSITISADATQDSRTPALDVLILGGQPIREPIAHYGPFVMNTREQIIEAVEDFQAGKLGTIPATPRMPHTAPGESAPHA